MQAPEDKTEQTGTSNDDSKFMGNDYKRRRKEKRSTFREVIPPRCGLDRLPTIKVETLKTQELFSQIASDDEILTPAVTPITLQEEKMRFHVFRPTRAMGSPQKRRAAASLGGHTKSKFARKKPKHGTL